MKNPGFILTLAAVLFPVVLCGQELPRPSMSRALTQHTAPTDYNMKVGPVLFNVNSSIEADYINNVALTNTNKINDFTLTPEVGVTASWPVTEANTLTFGTSIGYTKYLIHPQYDTSNILLAPDSNLSFDIYTGNFKINLHDDFSFQQDPVNEASFSNLVNFSRFQNIVGTNVLWDMNKVVVNFNYDHIDFITTQLQGIDGNNLPNPNQLNYSANQFSVAVEGHFTSTLIAGVEGAGSIRNYDYYTGDFTSYSAGPFIKLQATQHIKIQLEGGFQAVSEPTNFSSPNLGLPTGVYQPNSNGVTTNSYYADFTIDHELNKYYIHRLSVGHDLSLGILGDVSDTTYANYSGSWHVNSHLNLSFNLSYQDVSESGGFVTASSYQYFSAGVQANFPVTRKISGAIFYQFNDKIAEQSDQGYDQNKLGLILTYHY